MRSDCLASSFATLHLWPVAIKIVPPTKQHDAADRQADPEIARVIVASARVADRRLARHRRGGQIRGRQVGRRVAADRVR